MPTVVLDAVCADAVDLARAAAEEDAPAGAVGDYVEAVADGERVVTHYFVCLDPAYVGWRWAVTVARASRAKVVTIDEVQLVAGPDSVVAPEWVPWIDRVQPGDLGAGDLLPHRAVDPLLVPGYTGVADADAVTDELAPPQWEIGLGRARVLSVEGRDDATDRWVHGSFGSDSAQAVAAPGQCATCGYLITIGGPLGQAFGICAHRLSPADGHVVPLDFGCGAHSEATAVPEPGPVAAEESVLELVDLSTYEPPVAQPEERDADQADADSAPADSDADAPVAEQQEHDADHEEPDGAEGHGGDPVLA